MLRTEQHFALFTICDTVITEWVFFLPKCKWSGFYRLKKNPSKIFVLNTVWAWWILTMNLVFHCLSCYAAVPLTLLFPLKQPQLHTLIHTHTIYNLKFKVKNDQSKRSSGGLLVQFLKASGAPPFHHLPPPTWQYLQKIWFFHCFADWHPALFVQ